MARNDAHTGSRFDDLLKEVGIFDEVQAKAQKRALPEQLAERCRQSLQKSSTTHGASEVAL